MNARMYVSKKAVRTESEFNGQQRVEIAYPKQQRRVMLLPQRKQYMEQQDTAPAPTQQRKPGSNPCKNIPKAKCKSLGKETLNGRKVEKWEVLKDVNGRQLRSLHWIDVQRHLALREFFPDGTVSEMKLAGLDEVNGRQAEKWELTMTYPDGRKSLSKQWYDPQLKITIREEMPGGYLRELRNIKVGKQSRTLFDIPKDYQKISPPPAAPVPGGVVPR